MSCEAQFKDHVEHFRIQPKKMSQHVREHRKLLQIHKKLLTLPIKPNKKPNYVEDHVQLIISNMPAYYASKQDTPVLNKPSKDGKPLNEYDSQETFYTSHEHTGGHAQAVRNKAISKVQDGNDYMETRNISYIYLEHIIDGRVTGNKSKRENKMEIRK